MRQYRGQDRRLLSKAKKAMDLITARDTRVLDPKKTSAVSNRVQIFPAIDTDLTDAVAAVRAQITAKLAATV